VNPLLTPLRAAKMGQKHSTMPSPPPVDNRAVYRSLPVDEKSIRLVRILSDGQLELKVFLMEPFNSSRGNSGTPTYYALSYCWFNSPHNALWQCNGLDFLTTRTLDNFFLSMPRYSEEPEKQSKGGKIRSRAAQRSCPHDVRARRSYREERKQ
jgi:hypothetical protein